MKFKSGYSIDDDTIGISKMSIEYIQNADCEAENQDDVQVLEISTEHNGSDFYYILKTDRWAIDNVSEMKQIIEDFESRLNLK